MTDRYSEAFREEAVELLSELEVALLDLERDPQNLDSVGRVFRALHTIKGSGAMFGFDAISSFAHAIETVFEGVRGGSIPVTPELIGVALSARDHLDALLHRAGASSLEEAGRAILERLRIAAPPPGLEAVPPSEVSAPPPAPPTGEKTSFRIRFDPAPDLFLTGTNPMLLLDELAALGELSLLVHVDRVPELDEIDPELCYCHWDAVLTTAAGENAVRDVFIFVEDRAKIAIDRIPDQAHDGHPRVGDVLIERGDVAREALETHLRSRPLVGEALVQAGLVTQDRVDAALVEQRHLDALQEKRRKAEAAATLRVPAAKLDSLVDIVGELVTVQARLSGHALDAADAEINFIAEEIERLTELLRESVMGIRMLPIGDTFQKFKRLVRDLSAELGKKVELTTEGDETELDKTVIEQLSDPLVHLIRNAVDHGIESPERRLAAGKPETGKVHLSASHAGAHVLIRLADDGAGLDREAILARAIEHGLAAPGATLTEQETYALILKPGFSTARQVTGVSGRGVGMDVVERGVDALRGSLAVSSQPGHGTVITLKIPLTLAIIEGLLVQAGRARFVVPLANILECIEIQRRGAGGSAGRRLVTLREEVVPYIALRERFAIAGDPPAIEQVIVADTHAGKFGLVVDRVIGDIHTVIKKLGNLYRHVEEVSGATILGDGNVALILDVEKVFDGAILETRCPTAVPRAPGHSGVHSGD